MATITKEVSQTADNVGNPLIGLAQTKVADAAASVALNATFADTEVEAAFAATNGKINSIFRILEAHGLMKAS